MTTSFGIHSAVLLDIVSRVAPGTPVLFVDTGQLFAETYRYADELTLLLGLDLRVYQGQTSIAWTQARHGALWEQGIDGLDLYHKLHKVEPMKRALNELGIGVWLTGRRRAQSQERATLSELETTPLRWKVNPLVEWTDGDMERYMELRNLPRHPLQARGYVSVGDIHSTAPLGPGMRAEDTRHGGVKRECGIHLF